MYITSLNIYIYIMGNEKKNIYIYTESNMFNTIN